MFHQISNFLSADLILVHFRFLDWGRSTGRFPVKIPESEELQKPDTLPVQAFWKWEAQPAILMGRHLQTGSGHAALRNRTRIHTQVSLTPYTLPSLQLGPKGCVLFKLKSDNLNPSFTSQFNHCLLRVTFCAYVQNFIFGPLYSLE